MALSSEVIGHKKLFELWTRLLENDQITGSFLFVGPSGVGKKKTAWAFAQQALCEKSKTQACGHCGSCRRVAQHHHEGVLQIEPDGTQVKVEQAHDILQFLQLKSIGSRRFVIIVDAHKMNANAANSLLKTLEEPTDGTTLILLAPSLTSVLPTIRSRARVFHFQPIPPDEIKEFKSAPDWVFEASLGRFDLLEALSTPEEKIFRTQWAQYFLNFLNQEDLLTEEAWREALKNKEDLRLALDLWLKMIRDALFFQQGERKSLLTLDMPQILQKLAQVPQEKLHQAAEGIIQLQKDMSFNKDAVLALESLHISLRND